MRLIKRTPRSAVLILVALFASLAIAACGSSGSGGSAKGASSKNAAATSTTKGSASASRSAFTACLKAHGVTMPKRPGGFGFRHGTSTNAAPPTGTTQNGPGPGGGYPGGGYPGAGGGFFRGGGFAGGNSKLGKAFKACRSKLPASGFGTGRFRGGNGGHFTPHFSTRALEAYVSCIRKNGYPSMPEPNTSGSAKPVFPASVEKNPKFQAANRKCVSILRQAYRPPAAGQSTTQTTSTASTTSNA